MLSAHVEDPAAISRPGVVKSLLPVHGTRVCAAFAALQEAPARVRCAHIGNECSVPASLCVRCSRLKRADECDGAEVGLGDRFQREGTRAGWLVERASTGSQQ